MKDNVIPKQNCPECGYSMDRTSEVKGDDASPSPGDISLCLNCGFAAVFDDQLRMRRPTKEEELDIKSDERVIEFQIARAHVVTRDLRRK